MAMSRHSERSIWIKKIVIIFMIFGSVQCSFSVRPKTGEGLHCAAMPVYGGLGCHALVFVLCLFCCSLQPIFLLSTSIYIDVCAFFLFAFIEPDRRDKAADGKKETKILRKMVTNFIKRNRLEIIRPALDVIDFCLSALQMQGPFSHCSVRERQ